MNLKSLTITLYFSLYSALPIGGGGIVPGLFGSSQQTGDVAGVTNVVNNAGGDPGNESYNPWMMYPPPYMMMPPPQMQPQQQTFFIQDPKTDNPKGPLSELNSASLTDPLPPGQTV